MIFVQFMSRFLLLCWHFVNNSLISFVRQESGKSWDERNKYACRHGSTTIKTTRWIQLCPSFFTLFYFISSTVALALLLLFENYVWQHCEFDSAQPEIVVSLWQYYDCHDRRPQQLSLRWCTHSLIYSINTFELTDAPHCWGALNNRKYFHY